MFLVICSSCIFFVTFASCCFLASKLIIAIYSSVCRIIKHYTDTADSGKRYFLLKKENGAVFIFEITEVVEFA
jgi:hypothetical protein